MKEKYAELLLKKCLDLKNSSYLYIHYPKEAQEFVDVLENMASSMKVEVRKELDDEEKIVETLEKTPLEEIQNNPLFSRASWNQVAIDGGAILFLETVTEDYYQEVDNQKFSELMRVRRNSKPIYDQKRDAKELSWCIASYPSLYWANQLFPNEIDAYEKLETLIYQVCMVDKENPIETWNQELRRSEEKAEYLNSLGIKKLHYQNRLGTNFTVELPDTYLFCSAAEKNVYGVETIVNLPSYEVFTSPDYRTTEGIIYSSKPLFYQGRKIDQFSLTFEKGKVVHIEAKEGRKVLEGIIRGEDSSAYLGEVAFVDYHSPVSNTGKVFETTLLDENASCHVALGCGFSEALKDGITMTEEERYQKGVNKSKTHVDFMIGTPDLEITAYTKDDKEVPIFQNGDFIQIEKA